MISDRKSDASFLIHHFLSFYLRGEPSRFKCRALLLAGGGGNVTVMVISRSNLDIGLLIHSVFLFAHFNVRLVLMFMCLHFSAMQSLVRGSGSVLQPLQRCQSETGESKPLSHLHPISY